MTTPNTNARKRIITGFAAIVGTALMAFEAMPAQAAPPPHAPAHGYRRKQQQTQNNARRRWTPTRDDIDGDRIQNNRDSDMDGDGIPNRRDRDIDGDGISNTRDRYDYTSNRWVRDNRGRWTRRSGNLVQPTFSKAMGGTPAGYYRDRNGRLIRRATPVKRSVFTRQPVRKVGDKDRDGIRNSRDRDIDGDGVRNRRDRDKDGDRVRNRNDRFDKNPTRK